MTGRGPNPKSLVNARFTRRQITGVRRGQPGDTGVSPGCHRAAACDTPRGAGFPGSEQRWPTTGPAGLAGWPGLERSEMLGRPANARHGSRADPRRVKPCRCAPRRPLRR
jgi:hypothetical protein